MRIAVGLRVFSIGLCLALPAAGFAAPSRITQVTLYPGSAMVERVARVEAGALQLEMHCLPDSFNLQSVRVAADAGIQIGDVRIETLKREHTDQCSGSALETRIRTLGDQRAGIEAEQKANALAMTYLNSLGQPVAGERGNGSAAMPADARQLGQITAALNQNAKTVLTEQHQIARRAEALDRQLAILRQEQERIGGQQSNVRTITIRLKAAREGQVRVEYQIPQAGWVPAYQASLDFEHRSVALERQAVISQRSGEGWRGVKMRLATGRPDSSPAGALPDTWALDKAAEVTMRYKGESRSLPAAPAAAMAPPSPKKSGDVFDDAASADFVIETVQGQFATVFEVPGTVDLNSGADKLTLTLANLTVPATVRVRTTPRLEPAAYLVATITTPEGVWPAGVMQLRRNGAFVGTAAWNPAQGEQTTLPFGRDDRVQVKVTPHKRFERTAGLVGTRVEREMGMTYTVLNQHSIPMHLEVLEASPVSVNDDIKVRTTFSPQPTSQHWQDRRGVIVWEQEVGPAANAQFKAEYMISYPEGFRITGLPD